MNWFVVSLGIIALSFAYGLEWRYVLALVFGIIGIIQGFKTYRAFIYYFRELR